MKPWAMCWLPHATSVAFRRTRSSCRPWRQQGCEALRASVPRPFLLRRFWCLSCSAGGHQTFRYSCTSIGTIRFWYCHWKLHSSGYRIPPFSAPTLIGNRDQSKVPFSLLEEVLSTEVAGVENGCYQVCACRLLDDLVLATRIDTKRTRAARVMALRLETHGKLDLHLRRQRR